MAPTAEQVDQARAHARYTAARALPPDRCPYDPADPAQRMLASVWVRRYLAARPPAPGTVSYR